MKRISLIGAALFVAGCPADPMVGGGSGGSGTTPDAASSGGATGSGGATSGTGGGLGSGGTTVGGSGGAIGTGGRTSGGGGTIGTGGTLAGTGGRGGSPGTGGTTIGGGGQTGSHTNPLTQALIDSFVAAHNMARSGTLNPPPSPALPPVTWDPILADVAYNYVTKCLDMDAPLGLVDHNANRTSDYAALGGGSDYVGENIFASTANTVTAAQAVSNWMSEASLFTYGPISAGTSAAGHYTQVVWRGTTRIGCAIFNCPTTVMFHDTVLCDYAPGGNIIGQRPY